MDQQSHARPITPSLPKPDGNQQAPWNSVRWRSASKACACCGKRFRPWTKVLANGSLRVQKEKLWKKQRFCSISCSKIHSNCTQDTEVREKISRTMKARGHSPRVRGGNGDLSRPQKNLLQRLGEGWVAEHAVPVANHQRQSLPKNLKIDLANPQWMIAIELDGHSHQAPKRRLQDSRKTIYLAQNGWSVFRITNQRAEELFSTCMSPDTLLTSLTEPLSTIAISSRSKGTACIASSWRMPRF